MLETRELLTLHVDLADPHILSGPAGERRFIEVLGGTVAGDRLTGTILPGGADVQAVRGDGVVEMDIRAMLRTSEESLVYLSGRGLRHDGPGVLQRVAEGEFVSPTEYYFRECLFFETDDPALAWLTRLVAIGVGHRLRNSAKIEVFEVL